MGSLGGDAPQCLMQCVWCGIRQQAVLVKKLAHCIHALATPPDHPALAARCAPLRAFRLSGLVDKRRIEHAHTRGDDVTGGLRSLDYTPSARRNSQIDAQNTQ